jgi:hypothetical protein
VAGFELIGATRLDEAAFENEVLTSLLAYWRGRCLGRRMPCRNDIDPLDTLENLSRVHMLDVEAPGVFRYRIYGSGVTNPDRADMTGKTTLDYKDQLFGRLVTAHLGEAVQAAAPICYHIEASGDGIPYQYKRLTMPLSDDGNTVDRLMVGTQRIAIPHHLKRWPG